MSYIKKSIIICISLLSIEGQASQLTIKSQPEGAIVVVETAQGGKRTRLGTTPVVIPHSQLDSITHGVSYKIEIKDKPIDEMIYDLYIVHLRSQILPKETVRYGLIKEGKQALIELLSKDKDYIVELVLTMDSGSIFSYILKTEKTKPESLKLRAKFLHAIDFSPLDEANSRFLYTEFKQLNYARQIDQEGMLYLFSAWSQNPDNLELLKEMINYLERGQNNKKQLKSLYSYSFKRYGKTYTTKKDVDDQDNPEMILQQRIEIENLEARRKAEENSNRPPEVLELSPEEKMKLNLKKVKGDKSKESGEMLVH